MSKEANSNTTPLTFTVEIDRASDPIAGRVSGERDEIPFSGWVGFAAALERMLQTSRSEGPSAQAQG